MQSRPFTRGARIPAAAGFTLLELIVVVAILGMLTALLLPGLGRKDDAARRRDTDAAFEAIRAAILGPRGQTGPDGQPLIGGYVGAMGELPRLYATVWNPGQERWEVELNEDSPSPDELAVAGWYDKSADPSFTEAETDAFAQPLGLWAEGVRDNNGDWRRFSFPAEWRGPYMAAPRDPYPDDNPFEYGDGTDPEDRWFVLRHSEGRLQDGWGRAFVVLTAGEEATDTGAPRSLVFISAGPDGDYNPEGLLDDPPTGLNADNLIYRITRHEAEDTTLKIARTWARLQALRAAILAPRRTASGAQAEPMGYAADVGGVETLFGSFVYHGTSPSGRVYVCTRSHADTQEPSTGSSYWKAVTGTVDRAQFPGLPAWAAGAQYVQPRPYLLLANADHVLVDDVAYRCTEEEGAYCSGAPPASSDWEATTDVGFPELGLFAKDGTKHDVGECGPYQPVSNYYAGAGALPWWGVNTVDGQPPLALGWRGGYAAAPADGPPLWHDAWDRPLMVRVDHQGNVHLASKGVNASDAGDSSADDLAVTLFRHEFEVPVRVVVRAAGAIQPRDGGQSQSRVELWAPLNGKLHLWQAGANGTVPDEVFRFGRTESDDLSVALLPAEQVKDTDVAIKEVATDSAVSMPAERFVPVGRAYMEYRQQDFKNSDAGTGYYASPHPTQTTNGTSTGPPGCQKTVTIYPLGGEGYELCAD
ncbi:type II secretion system protein [Desulfocurvus vexinensis]|uniref:type II secretion system protein n=1 Tax=Desulfocurvus vexinensis TaxID=399548 RepID=UPI0004B63A16|nr:prepilin-type N-terminal cleavage/methylation domain-containing protein [Desulfocurvus vexinensis]